VLGTLYRRLATRAAPRERCSVLAVGSLAVSVKRRRGRTLRLRVRGSDGAVSVSAPLRVSDTAIQSFVAAKLNWIRNQQSRCATRLALFRRRFGDSFENGGVELRLFSRVFTAEDATALLRLDQSKLNGEFRERISKEVWRWYQEQLRSAAEPMLHDWAARMGVTPRGLVTRRMRSQWGSCNTRSGKIALNTELARRPRKCLEFVIVHELAHLIVPGHSRAFYAVMDQFLPDWRKRKAVLDRIPIRVG
jgi:predicted metal-dependent hydrolase